MRQFMDALNEYKIEDNPAFKKWFGNSKVVDKNGKPLIVYHGTNYNFNSFMTGSHFGDADAANSRLEYKGRNPDKFRHHFGMIVPVYLSIQNPLEIHDDGSLQNGWDYANAVYAAKAIDKTTYESIYNERSATIAKTRLFDYLKSKGYDGLVYRNEVEGKGLSWVIFDRNQAKSAVGNNGNFSSSKEEIDEATIKDGRKISFKVKEITDRNDSAWVQYGINAYVDSIAVGYLKIGFIPKRNVAKFFPNLWWYAASIGGMGGRYFLEDYPLKTKDWSAEQKVEIIKHYFMHLYLGSDPNIVTLDNIDTYWKRANQTLKMKYSRNFEKFKEFHVDKPLVDYIQVGYGYDSDSKLDYELQKKWSRKGIATALYVFGALWLYRKFGLRLHASGLQQPEAKAAWDKMASKGWVDTIPYEYETRDQKIRKNLNPYKLPLE